LIAVAEAEFRYSDLLPTGADDTPYRLDLVAQGPQHPGVQPRVRRLLSGPLVSWSSVWGIAQKDAYSPECVEEAFSEVRMQDRG